MLDVESQSGKVAYLHIVYLNAVVLTGLDCQLFLRALNAITYLPDVHDGVAIDNESHLVIASDSEDHRLVASRDKDRFKLGREVLEVYARGKHRVTAVAQHDRRREGGSSHRGTLHLRIIKIGGLHTLSALRCLQFTETTLEHLVARQSATVDIACLRRQLLDTLQGRYRPRGKAAVVTPHHHRVDGVHAQHGYLLVFPQRQCLLLVHQQHHALTGHVESQLLVGITGYDALRNLRPGV